MSVRSACRAALAGALLSLTVPAASPAADAGHWVAAWSASPSDASPVTPALSDETLRMIIHPTFGGTHVRLRLSNRFGSSPVTLGAVTIARRASGAAVVGGTSRPVTFRGSRQVVISRAAEIVSDPVDLRFSAFDDLAVSVDVSGTVQQPTEHFITRQTSYRSLPGSGDQTADDEGSLLRTSTQTAFSNGWFFISELDVLAPAETHTLVAFGDSITDGYQGDQVDLVENQADMNGNARWPDYLARRLAAAGRSDLSVANESISGNAVLEDRFPLPFGASALDRLDADALTIPGASDLIMLEGINDLGSDDATGEQVIDGLREVVQRAHAAGLRVHLATLLPSGGAVDGKYGSPAINAEREKVNAWIRTRSGADDVVDFDAAIRDPTDPTRMRPEFDSSDHLHPSTAGYRAMAEAIDLSALGPHPAQTAAAVAPGRPSATCMGRRTIVVGLPGRYRGRVRRATVILDGRRLATIRGGRTSARVPVRGLPAGRVTLRVVMRLRDGRTVRLSHSYRACGSYRT